jgi:hypothetical protein
MAASFTDPTLDQLADVRVGDEVTMDGLAGLVLVNFETGEADPAYGLQGWGEEPGGLLVDTVDAGLVRHAGFCFPSAREGSLADCRPETH